MASIHGLSLKMVKKFTGHEGEPLYQGSLYLGKDRIGFWSQDYHGGVEDNLDLYPQYSGRKLRELVKEKCSNEFCTYIGTDGTSAQIPYDLEVLMIELLELMETEKEYKKYAKDGYPVLVVCTDGCHYYYRALTQHYSNMSLTEIEQVFPDAFAKMDATMFDNCVPKHLLYKGLGDFVVGEPFLISNIMK